ncbi:MAG: sulfotransferase domain-containing protein [Hyphomonadaceae bacterium]
MHKLYMRKARKDRWGNFTILRHGAFDGMLCTSKNSGTHWLKYMLAIALAETYGIEPPEYFSEDAVRPYISWTKDKPVHAQLPKLAFSHTIPHQLADWGWARTLAGLPPYVLLVRHPMSILASHFAKWEWDIKVDWLTYLEGEPGGKKYRCDLYWIARFWNRWGEWLERERDRIHLVHYEDVRQAPRATLEAIAAHWGIKFTPAALDAAVKGGTKDAMADKIDPSAEPNVLQNRKDRLEDLFAGRAQEIYESKINDLFKATLGYDLMSIPSL